MIVRDEEPFLPRCLESVRNVVDEIIVVDTGSTDRTLEIAKELTDLPPDLCSTGQALPPAPNQTDQFETFIDRHYIVFGIRKSPGMSDSIDQESLDVGFHFEQHRIVEFNLTPCVEGE